MNVNANMAGSSPFKSLSQHATTVDAKSKTEATVAFCDNK
jgi:hypothetical protein